MKSKLHLEEKQMRQRIILFCALFCLTSSLAMAGNPDSIWFAGQYIKIGTPKAKIFSKLVADYKLSKVGDIDQWGISTNSQPSRVLGIIAFENEKVSFINKSWGSFDESSTEPFQTLFRALSSLSEEGHTVAILQTTESKDPQGSIKEVRLHFGNKYFSITIHDLKDHENGVGFSEVLQK